MKEEDKIQKKIGTENPFRVPEGYFENLTSEVMNRLPEKEKLIAVQTEPTMWQKVRPWLYMTAMFVFLFARHVYRCGIDYPCSFFGAYSICRAYGC